MSDRDSILYIKKKLLPDGGIFFDLKTVDHPDAPSYPGVIRMFHVV